MDLTRLRQETAAEHVATEETVPLMSESLTVEQYVDVLRRFYRVVAAWDGWADAHVPDDLKATLAGRRRAGLLAQDLRSLGVFDPPAEIAGEQMEATAVEGDPRAVFLGRMYVMEGSTLGGQLIARHLERQLGLTPGTGNSFFRGYGEDTAERWREFRSILAAVPDEDTDTVIASAKNMFSLFADHLRQ